MAEGKTERRKSFLSPEGMESVKQQSDGERMELDGDRSVHSFVKVGTAQVLCGVTIVLGLWIVPLAMGINLIDQPVKTLQICLAFLLPVELIAFSTLRLQPTICPVWWAALRGLLSLPVGIVVASFVAVVFGAPTALESGIKTLNWAALVSTLTVVPAAAALGSSWSRWHRLFACTEPNGPLEIAICLPAHGAAIGAWVGAWPMPLDWDRPWQEWPVCCTYGAVGGYVLCLFVSLLWNSANMKKENKDKDKKSK